MPQEEQVDIDEVVASLKTMLKTEVPDDVLRADVDRYVNRYLMDVESAKRGVIREHGGSLRDYIPPETEPVHISDLRNGDVCTVCGVVISEPVRRKPKNNELMEFDISDGTGTIKVTVWSPVKDVEEGASYTFRSAKASEFRGTLGISVSAGAVVPYNGAPFEGAPATPAVTDVGELVIGTRDVTVRGCVSRIFDRSSNPKAPTQSGIFTMNGTDIRFAHWGDYNLETGEYVIRGVSVKDNRGSKELRFPETNRARRVERHGFRGALTHRDQSLRGHVRADVRDAEVHRPP